MKNIYKIVFSFLSFCICTSVVEAKVSLPAIFSDHMVLQQQSTVKIWGWGSPFEHIIITNSWSSDTIETVVGNQAHWMLEMDTPKASRDHSITVQGYNRVEITDVLIGEVWLLTGQSNMQWNTRAGITNLENCVEEATDKDIRFFSVAHRSALVPNDDIIDGEWLVCSPETMIDFSSIGYFFGKKLHDQMNLPVGLINSSWGGSPIEIWIPENRIINTPELFEASKKQGDNPYSPVEPGRGYNAMIAPLMPFSIAGNLWYQGESNVCNPEAYVQMLTQLTESWREGFQSNFPFFFAQIAPYKGYEKDAGVKVREMQRRAQSIPNSGMIVLSDIGDTTDIHPRNKIDVGERFADAVLNKIYHLDEFSLSGPIYQSHTFVDGHIVLNFDHSEGLHDDGNAIQQFELQDAEGDWYPAKAIIRNETIIISSDKVLQPVHIRFAWSNVATPRLMNKHNLPTSCFNTNPDFDN